MNIYPTNLCTRCGTPRIVAKTWREGNITITDFICPDQSCQKVVDADLKKKRIHLSTLQKNSQRRRAANIKKRKKAH